MKRSLYLILTAITCFPAARSFSQKIDSVLLVYHDEFPQEKTYVQFDKSYYTPGETIWFKAYTMAGLELSAKSKNFYAELIDENGKVLQRKISPMVEASAAGSFDLPSNITSSFLRFRAYTTWMLNFDT